jgi:two-component system, NarL family, sensor kinase
VSAGWLAAVLTVLCGWSAAFAWRVYRSGLSRVLVAADIVVIAAVVATQGHVAPAGMTAAGTSWILPLASTAIYIALLALRPAVGLPALLLVGAAYVATVPHPADAWFLVVQAAVTAILVGLIRRGGRKADAVVAVSLQAEQERQAEAAGRADEREHHRQLHDTMLSTLTMVAAGAFDGPSATLSAQAARDLDAAAASRPGRPATRRVPPTCAPGCSRSRRRRRCGPGSRPRRSACRTR